MYESIIVPPVAAATAVGAFFGLTVALEEGRRYGSALPLVFSSSGLCSCWGSSQPLCEVAIFPLAAAIASVEQSASAADDDAPNAAVE